MAIVNVRHSTTVAPANSSYQVTGNGTWNGNGAHIAAADFAGLVIANTAGNLTGNSTAGIPAQDASGGVFMRTLANSTTIGWTNANGTAGNPAPELLGNIASIANGNWSLLANGSFLYYANASVGWYALPVLPCANVIVQTNPANITWCVDTSTRANTPTAMVGLLAGNGTGHANRTLTGDANIAVANGTGVSGNPTLSLQGTALTVVSQGANQTLQVALSQLVGMTGNNVIAIGNGTAVGNKALAVGANMTLTSNATTVTLNSTGGGGGGNASYPINLTNTAQATTTSQGVMVGNGTGLTSIPAQLGTPTANTLWWGNGTGFVQLPLVTAGNITVKVNAGNVTISDAPQGGGGGGGNLTNQYLATTANATQTDPWQPESGGNANIGDGASTNPPTIGNLNGNLTVYFDGSNDYLSGNLTVTGEFTLIWAGNWTDGLAAYGLLFSCHGGANGTDGWIFGHYPTNTAYIQFGDGTIINESGNATLTLDSNPHVYALRVGASGVHYRIDGALLWSAGNLTASTGSMALHVGHNQSGGGDFAGFQFFEIRHYDTEINDSDLAIAEAEIAAAYGI